MSFIDSFDVEIDLDDNETSMEEEEDEPLSWRLNSSDSLSDWTVEIKQGSKVTFYHVHKNFLAVGPRKSDYFLKLFKSNVAESNTSTSTIELEDTAADAFPFVLDYMYGSGGDTEVDVTTERAVALRYLAQYFGIRKLFSDVTEFARKDLSPETATVYLEEAALYQDDKIIAAASKICAENMEQIFTLYSTDLVGLRPDLFQMVVTSDALVCDSTILSEIVAEFCEARPESIDKAFLETLTSAERMPEVHPSVALELLKLSLSFHEKDDDGCCTADSLQKRCMDSLAISWKKSLVKPLEEANDSALETSNTAVALGHHDLPHTVQRNLLEASLCLAGDEFKSKDDAIRRKDAEIKRLTKQNRELNAEMVGLRFRSSRLDVMESEMKKFVRVKNSHNFGTLRDYDPLTAKHYKRHCTYSASRTDRYGDKPPHAMPLGKFGNAAKEGYLYQDKNGKRWPVFYYKGSS